MWKLVMVVQPKRLKQTNNNNNKKNLARNAAPSCMP